MATTDIAAARPKSMDYRFLRAEGIRHIQRLAGHIWTDHNLHDPGVTMLEALCFALTDLGLRTYWDMPDQLKSYAGGKELGQDFYAQHEILPNAACTPMDFRKRIIDFVGLERKLDKGVSARIVAQNVWLRRAIPSEVPPITLVLPKPDRIGQEEARLELHPQANERPFIVLNGLYETHLYFERNLSPWLRNHALRDLNSRQLRGSFQLTPSSPTTWYTVVFPAWDETPPAYIYGSLNNPQPAGLLDGGSSPDQWILHFVNAGTQGPVLPVGLNVEVPEDFPLLQEHSHQGSVVSRRTYPFCIPQLAAALLAMIPSNTLQVHSVTHQGEGLFWVEIYGLHTPLTSFAMRCKGPWGQLEESSVDEFRSLITQQLPLWLRQMVDVHKKAISEATSAIGGFFAQYQQRLQAINDYVEGPQKQPELGLRSYLCCQRNLCEDWLRFKQVPIEEIALEGELVLAPGAAAEEVLTEIYYQVGLFLCPMPRFQTLAERLESGQDPAAVFEGPLLQHGFLADEDLGEDGERQHYVFCSDLVRIIMGLPGVASIQGLGISGYVHGRKVVDHATNCLALSYTEQVYYGGARYRTWRKPQLDEVRSLLRCTRDGVALPHGVADVHDALDQRLEAARAKRIPQAYAPVSVGGDDMQTAIHQSVQDDLPQQYGTSAAGMSEWADDSHKGKVKQLKGYLLFFDQLLANYLGQLNRIRELFTFRDAGSSLVDATYFVQVPDTVPQVEALLLPFVQGFPDWQQFRADLQAMAEGEAGFLARRNVFLSHIAARFGESFADYAAKSYAWHYAHATTGTTAERSAAARLASDKRLIADKKDFLLDYPRIGAHRGRGFCLRKRHPDGSPDQWDSHNVTGLKRRVCRLLGIQDERRRHLTAATQQAWTSPLSWNTVSSTLGLRLRVDRNGLPYVGEGPYVADMAGIAVLKQQLLTVAHSAANYQLAVGTKYITAWILYEGKRFFSLDEQVVIANYPSETAAKEVAMRLVNEAAALFAEEMRYGMEVKALPEEGFHVIEHILLRPKSLTDPLLRLPSGNVRAEFHDPYSMRATIILPRWTGRFRDDEFGSFVERTVRLETPAHVQPWVIWVNDTPDELLLLHQLEVAWRAWLEANALAAPSASDISQKLATLVQALNAFHTHFLYND